MKFTEEQNKILRAAIDVFGYDDQEKMAIGECGEFLSLQGKRAQGRDTQEDWISEIADVIIMIEQMSKMYGEERVQEMIDFKMNRLKDRIQKHGFEFS